jgi:hypothetical protein
MRDPQLRWLLPADLLVEEEVLSNPPSQENITELFLTLQMERQPDRFLICGESYSNLRDAIARFALDHDAAPLDTLFQVLILHALSASCLVVCLVTGQTH